MDFGGDRDTYGSLPRWLKHCEKSAIDQANTSRLDTYWSLHPYPQTSLITGSLV